jgi:type II secretory pathway predicted ATPase ExeA
MDNSVQAFYGFHRPPFGPVTVPCHLIHLASRNRLIDDAVAHILAGRSVIAFGGEHGAGKTVLIAAIIARLQERQILTIQGSSAFRSPVRLQRIIGAALGLEGDLALDPQRWLRAVQDENAAPAIVLLFDDADLLSAAMLHYLWLLIRLFDFGAVKLHLVLIGGLGRWPGLEHPDLAGLRQMADPRTIVMPLEDNEAVAYISEKLRLAGGSLRRVMTDAALLELLELAGGIPGRLDALAEAALTQAYQNGCRRITGPVMQAALPGALEMIMPLSPVQSSWRSVSMAALALVAAVGAGMGFILRNAPAMNAHPFATPALGRSAATLDRQAPVTTTGRLPAGS